jgi:glutathione S-transferase
LTWRPAAVEKNAQITPKQGRQFTAGKHAHFKNAAIQHIMEPSPTAINTRAFKLTAQLAQDYGGLSPRHAPGGRAKEWSMEYVSVAHAKSTRGLRLVLSAGVPGPWGEAAKAVLATRKVSFTPVLQEPMGANLELRAWTGIRNAPVAVYDDEPPQAGWYEILMLSERLGSGPSLLPSNSADRALCLGYAMEICAQDGFGWYRRVNIMAKIAGTEQPAGAEPHQREYWRQYGISKAAVERAPKRTAAIQRALAAQIKTQRARGSQYLVGDGLTAVDLYWACFSQMVRPLEQAVNPMPDYLRPLYSELPEEVAAAMDPVLIEHRDLIFERHIGLPLDF